jgi:hypothetical protein
LFFVLSNLLAPLRSDPGSISQDIYIRFEEGLNELSILKSKPDKTIYTGSYCARLIEGATKAVRKAQSLQTALKMPAVYSPNLETGQRRSVLGSEHIN